MPPLTPLLSAQKVSKTFGDQRVLTAFDFAVEPGEVHALVGHNGSGKSTFVKILAGFHEPDPGSRILVEGDVLQPGSATAAKAAGIRFVHQDLGLVDALSSVDNMFLGEPYPMRSGGVIDWPAARHQVSAALAEIKLHFDPELPVGALSPAQRTGLAIARAVRDTQHGRVLVLDEPTAGLSGAEAETLFASIRALLEHGFGVIYISHHLQEVLNLAQRVTVLRDGRKVTTAPTSDLSEERLVELMIGSVQVTHSDRAAVTARERPVVLQTDILSARGLRHLDLELRAGEILGVTGVDGSGREAVAPAIFGATDRSGTVMVQQQALPRLRPDVAVTRGVGYVPAQRVSEALLSGMSVAENMTAARLVTSLRGLRLDQGAELSEVEDWIGRVGLRPPNPHARVQTLSGGNQQKVVVARWLRLDPQVLVLDEPTQGVDVASRVAIWDLINQAVNHGAGVLVCSSDTEELAVNCDRVIVLAGGVVADEVAGTDLTADVLDALSLRQASGAAA